MSNPQYPTRLPCGSRVLDLAYPHVVGTLNVIPDSFSDGDRYDRLDDTLWHVERMMQEGATLTDVGGESTRPGMYSVSPTEELERVAPVAKRTARKLDVAISVDTSTPAVVRETARLGAGLTSDVRSLQRDGALDAAANSGLVVCPIYMREEPQIMQDAPVYQDVVAEAGVFLQERVGACAAAGIDRERLLLDPGFGFAKTLEYNLVLFRHPQALHDLGLSLLVDVSCKSMIGKALGREVGERLYGSLALAVLALAKSARITQMRDVAVTADVMRTISAVETTD